MGRQRNQIVICYTGFTFAVVHLPDGPARFPCDFLRSGLEHVTSTCAGSPNLFTVGDRAVVGVGGKSGDYLVLDRTTGDLVWKTKLTTGGKGGGVTSTAAVADSKIYVASNHVGTDGTILALRAEDGSIL